jgi:hypothetical protein
MAKKKKTLKKTTKKTLKKASKAKAKKASKPSGRIASPRNIGRKIKNLALQTQKTVSGQLYTQTEALKTRLSAYGIGVDDVKAGAKHLEQVLKDIRGREFLKQPGVQNLVERVTRKNVEKANLEAQKMAEKVPRKKRLSSKQKEKQNRQFNALSEQTAQAMGSTVVQAIMKRVEEVRRTISAPLSASGRRKIK